MALDLITFITNNTSMRPITISTADMSSYNDFIAGNSIQVRVEADDSDLKTYLKDRIIKVVHDGLESKARIVSDPLVVSPSSENGPRTISLIIEKT